MVFICHVTLRDHVIKALFDVYGLERLKISHHTNKFGVHRHCGSGDIMVLVCHVISQDHVIKGSCDFMGGSPTVSPHPAKFGSHRHCGS